jgi:proliferating cell nuclear antigen
MPGFTVNYKHSEPKYDEFFTETSLGFRTKNTTKFKQIMKFLASVVESVNFEFNTNGLKIQSMSQSHISLIDILIPLDLFQTYNCGNGFVAGVNMKNIVQIFNHLKSSDELVIRCDQNCDSLDIYYLNEKYSKNYTLNLMDIDSEELDIQDLGDMSQITLESKYFNEILSDFSDIGEQLRIKILESKEKISLKCDGSFSSLKVLLQNDETIKYRNLKDIELFFNIEIMTHFTKCHNLNKNISIKIGQNLPLEFRYDIFDSGYIKYYIAPRMDDDDN